MSKNKLITYASISIAVILWGLSFIWTNSIIKTSVPVFTFIFLRMFIAGVSLFVVSKLTKKLQKIEKKDIKWFLLLVFFEPFIYFIGETLGIKYTNSPTVSALVIALIPVLTMIVSSMFFSEKLTFAKVTGALMTFIGIAIMVVFKGEISVDYQWGIALLFAAVIGAVGWSSVVKKLSTKYNPFTIATYQFMLGAVYFLPVFLFTNNGYQLSLLLRIDFILPLLALAILCSCLAFSLYILSIKEIGLTQTAVFVALIPAVSALTSHLLGIEIISWVELIGIIVVITGVIIVQELKLFKR